MYEVPELLFHKLANVRHDAKTLIVSTSWYKVYFVVQDIRHREHHFIGRCRVAVEQSKLHTMLRCHARGLLW